MARQQKIPEQQLQRVHRLEQKLEDAAARGDLKKSKQVLDDYRLIKKLSATLGATKISN